MGRDTLNKQDEIEELRVELRRMERSGDGHNAISEGLRSRLWELENIKDSC